MAVPAPVSQSQPNESLFEKKAAINRAMASNQLLLDEIIDRCARDRNSATSEYWQLDRLARQLTNDYTEPPKEPMELKKVLLRMKELRRITILSDEVGAGAKYGVDTDDPTVQSQSRYEE